MLALKNIVRLSNGQATKPFPNKVTYPLLTTVNLFSLHGLMVGKSNPRGTLVWAPSLCAVPAVVPVGATWGAESQGPAQCVRRVQTRHVCSVCVKINLSHQHIFVTSTLCLKIKWSTATPPGASPSPSDLRSSAGSGPISTWMGDHLGRPGAVGGKNKK